MHGEFDLSYKCCSKVLELATEQSTANINLISAAKLLMASCIVSMPGDLYKACSVMTEAYQAISQALGIMHSKVVIYASNTESMSVLCGNVAEAQQHLSTAENVCKNTVGKQNLLYSYILVNSALLDVMTSAEQSEKILTKRTQAEEIQRQYDPRHLIQSLHSPL